MVLLKALLIGRYWQQLLWKYATAASTVAAAIVTAMCCTIVNVVAERAVLIVHIARPTPVFVSPQLFASS